MRILGIGLGLFLLSFLWTLAIVVLLLTGRAKSPYSSLGPIVLLVTTLITILLLVIPRAFPGERDVSLVRETRKPIPPAMDTDWMYFWRSIILFINLVTVIIASTFIYVHWIAKSMARLKAPSIEVLYSTETMKQKIKLKEKTKGKKKNKKNIPSQEEDT